MVSVRELSFTLLLVLVGVPALLSGLGCDLLALSTRARAVPP